MKKRSNFSLKSYRLLEARGTAPCWASEGVHGKRGRFLLFILIEMSVSTAELTIKQQLAALSPAKRALLELRLLKKKALTYVADESIPRRSEQDSAPLSYMQEGLWVLSQLMLGTSLYHIPKAVRLTGKLNPTALKQTLDQIVARHESLRTSFAVVEGIPKQVITESMPVDLPLRDLAHLPQADRETEAQRIVDEEARRPFD